MVRTSLAVPALAEAVRSGKVTISKARKVCSIITDKDAEVWIELAATCSARIVEKAVAQASPKEAVRETL